MTAVQALIAMGYNATSSIESKSVAGKLGFKANKVVVVKHPQGNYAISFTDADDSILIFNSDFVKLTHLHAYQVEALLGFNNA